MGTKQTFGIFFVSFVDLMRLAVLPRRGKRRTSVAASLVGTERHGIAGVIVSCEAPVDPFCRLQYPLRCWIWRIHYGRCV